ncbi:hypothetical protein [Streptomyces nigrescens]|uniref:hypothetical protein n=1 Tax=Streptomyces nigrescens TaxID=1920 RepID=UPI0034938184
MTNLVSSRFGPHEQVHMDRWHRGRVVLVGDSAWCVTLYAGMGASAGLAGADLLGTMLDSHPDNVGRALAKWENALRPYVEHYQHNGAQQVSSSSRRTVSSSPSAT